MNVVLSLIGYLKDLQGNNMLAIIGGSGIYSLNELVQRSVKRVVSRYTDIPVDVICGSLNSERILFLPRHGDSHKIPPHRINYLANIDALSQCGATQILAICSVGGITSAYPPETLAIPHQIIDYTWGRASTFFEENFDFNSHIDFTDPFSSEMQSLLVGAADRIQLPLVEGGVYGCTQGPRLETRAEIKRMAQDGCDLVGMTMMPEAALAREKGIEYCAVCPVVNWAAGMDKGVGSIDDIHRRVAALSNFVNSLIYSYVGLR